MTETGKHWRMQGVAFTLLLYCNRIDIIGVMMGVRNGAHRKFG